MIKIAWREPEKKFFNLYRATEERPHQKKNEKKKKKKKKPCRQSGLSIIEERESGMGKSIRSCHRIPEGSV